MVAMAFINPKRKDTALDGQVLMFIPIKFIQMYFFYVKPLKVWDLYLYVRSTIPLGKTIFMSFINGFPSWDKMGIPIRRIEGSCSTQNECCRSSSEITINEVTINEGLEKLHRVISPFFEIDLSQNNIFGLSSGKRRCISDGYWIL